MAEDDGDAEARMETGVLNQRLIVEGWFASHADKGTPGPHVHFRTSDKRDAVLKTEQIPELIDIVTLVGQRIDQRWTSDGQQYTDDVLRHSPDPNDPETIRRERVTYLEFAEKLSARMPEVVALVQAAETTDEALTSVAALLDVDEVAVMIRLARFDLLSLTRPAGEARRHILAELRDE